MLLTWINGLRAFKLKSFVVKHYQKKETPLLILKLMAENKSDFLTAVSYNCRGINSSTHDIQELCKTNQIVFLQETWLSKQQLNKSSTISNHHYSSGIFGLNYEDGFKLGRPYRAEAILWNKSLRASIIHNFDKSFIGLKLELDKSSLFLINVYMPCSTYHNIDEYVEKLSKLASFCKELNNSNICLLRDFNAGPENSFWQNLQSILSRQFLHNV